MCGVESVRGFPKRKDRMRVADPQLELAVADPKPETTKLQRKASRLVLGVAIEVVHGQRGWGRRGGSCRYRVHCD